MTLLDGIHIVDKASMKVLEHLACLHGRAFKQLGQKGWNADQIGSSLDQAGGQLAYIVVDDCIAGFALYKTALDETELFTLAIDPVQQRAGLAFRLLTAVLNSLKKKGTASFFLEVRCDNVGAISCYEKLGFELIAARQNYYTDDAANKIDASIYRLSL